MAKAKLNSGLAELRGRISDWVYRQTPEGTTVSRRPIRTKRWSAEQKKRRLRMQVDAAGFYKNQTVDPARRAHYQARARALGIPISAFVMGGFMKYGEKFAAMEGPGTIAGHELPGRDGDDDA